MENYAYKPSLMSQISHELRIPITGIMGMAHFLSEMPLTAQQQDCVQVIMASAERLLALEGKLHELLQQK